MNELVNFGINEEKLWNWFDGVKLYWSLKCNEGEVFEDFLYWMMVVFVYDKEDRKI